MNRAIIISIMAALLCFSLQASAQVSQRDSLMLDSIEAAMTKNLKQVEVNASNIVHLKDKDVIYITREMRKGSYDTGELLGKVPGMIYNKLTKELEYQGQKKILILVDSLEMDAGYVKDLYHLRFDKIEIIPQPKGKYADYDVLINLHRKENYQGYENQGFAVGNIHPGGREVKGNPFGGDDWLESFTYTYNKWNFYVMYLGAFDQDEENNLSTTQYLLNNYAEEVIDNADGTRNKKTHFRGHRVNTSIDYQFDKHNSISLTYDYQWTDNDERNPKTIVRSDLEGNVQDTIGSTSFSNVKWQRHSFAGFYRGGIGVWNYTASINYIRQNTNSDYNLEKTSGYQTTDNRWSRMDHTFGKAEVNRRFLNDKIYWALGYDDLWKSYVQKSAETRENLSNYTLKQSTVWTYGYYNVTDKASLSVLASITTNKTKGDEAKDRYLSWRGDLTYYQRMKHDQWLRLNYSCNISNPDLTKVTSYGQFSDSLTWSGGNPQLRSSVSHWARLQYYFLRCLTVSLEESYQPRTFTDITTLEYGGLQNGQDGYYAATMPQNAKWNSTTASLNFSKHIKAMTISVDMSYWHACGKYQEFKHDINGWRHRITLDYNIQKWDLTPMLILRDISDYGAWAQGHYKSQHDQIRVMIFKYFCHRRIRMYFQYMTPLHFTKGKNTSVWENPATVAHYRNFNKNKRDNNFFGLSFQYQLRGGKSVRQYNRELSEEN